ncbi:MAG: hypothetical protein RLZZ585_169 [Bacteroidota bacterium]|jgi:hypothetical protein
MEEKILVIQKIIEQESKTSTYKFALLRAVIDLISSQSPFIEVGEKVVKIPVTLISDKWLFYYWDLIENGFTQIRGDRKLAFEVRIQSLKSDNNFLNYWDLNKALHRNNYTTHDKELFSSTIKELNNTIIKNPARYLGSSSKNGDYSFFQIEKKEGKKKNVEGFVDLIENSPKICFDLAYHDVFKSFGGLISGSNSIILNWIAFMNKKNSTNDESIASEPMTSYGNDRLLSIMIQEQVAEREVKEIREFWVNRIRLGIPVFCAWSGKRIKEVSDLAIDHAVPFSVMFNNDYWNLLPCLTKVNGKKSDKILSTNQIQLAKERILDIWNYYNNEPKLSQTFQAHCQISLTGASALIDSTHLLDKFTSLNEFFIDSRGMESWEC